MTAKEAKTLTLSSQSRLRDALVKELLDCVRKQAEEGATGITFPFSHPPPNDGTVKETVKHLRELGYECVLVRRGAALLPNGALHLRWDAA